MKMKKKNYKSLRILASNTNVLCECVAQFPWKARNDGDLSFAKGDIIEVVAVVLSCKLNSSKILDPGED